MDATATYWQYIAQLQEWTGFAGLDVEPRSLTLLLQSTTSQAMGDRTRPGGVAYTRLQSRRTIWGTSLSPLATDIYARLRAGSPSGLLDLPVVPLEER